MENKKTISVVVPILNEVAMVEEIYTRVAKVFETMYQYTFELVFFDDGSTDGTKEAIEALSKEHAEVKGVFYTRNFGYLKNTFYAMQQAKGDCAFLLHADLQNPPELIPQFIEKWEAGAQVVLGIKHKSRENKFMYFLRSVFYFFMTKVFGVNIKPHATEFELFDKSFVAILKQIKANNPFLRGIVSEYAANVDYVYYVQDARAKGKSKFNVNKYYDFAICGITNHSKKLPRHGIAFTLLCMLGSILEFIFYFLPHFAIGGLFIRCAFFAICVFMLFLFLLFEFRLSAKEQEPQKPMVVEEKRINY